MAQIIKKKTKLDRAYNRSRCMTWACALLAALCGGACLLGSVTILPPLILGGAVGTFLFLGAGVLSGQKTATYRTGIDGENATAALISGLPDSYFGFQNLTVRHQGRESELDMVVVGPTGIYVIETKSHNGNIRGSYEGTQWTQYKTGRRGGTYAKTLYNPVKQVGTHVYRLANYLRDRGCKVHVDAAVLFVNPQTGVQLTGKPGETAVYAGKTGAQRMLRQIRSAPKTLTPQLISKICQTLSQC